MLLVSVACAGAATAPLTRVQAGIERMSAAGTFSGVVVVAKNGVVVFAQAYGLADRARNVPNRIDTEFNHTSGLGDYFQDPGYDRLQGSLTSLHRYLPLIERERLAFTPDARFSYSNSGFILAGLIIEHVSGESYYDYAGGCYSTAGDLVRFANALVHHRLLNRALTREVTSSHVRAPGGGYGYGFGDRTSRAGAPPTIWHNGGAPGVAGELDIDSRLGVTVAVLENRDPTALRSTMQLILGALHIL
jgi:CubicO group peptidase (beta-lactamase class C family)